MFDRSRSCWWQIPWRAALWRGDWSKRRAVGFGERKMGIVVDCPCRQRKIIVLTVMMFFLGNYTHGSHGLFRENMIVVNSGFYIYIILLI